MIVSHRIALEESRSSLEVSMLPCGFISTIVVAAQDGVTNSESPDCSTLVYWLFRPSNPSRNDSSDLEIWPSCDVGSRFKETALCLSSRESFMWSARRKSWFGFDIANSALLCT